MSIRKFLGQFEVYVGAVLSGLMFVVLFMQVVSRYVFNSSFSWSEEFALILFIWSIYFGATAAIRRRQHLRLEILLDRLKPKGKLIIHITSNVFFAVFNCIILFGIIPIVLRLMRSGTATAVLSIPKWINYGVLPLLFVLMIFRLIQESIIRVNDYKVGRQQTGGSSPGN
jgi:C4-dicarboxylate transporter DctQ subunit